MKRLVIVGVATLIGLAPMAADASIIYRFETTLSLLGGPDSAVLDGKTMSFTATIPDAAVYGVQFGIPAVESTTHSWTISGGSTVDGTYVDPTSGAEWYGTFAGWFSDGSMFNGIAGFTSLAIWHTGGTVLPGDLVQTSDFLGFRSSFGWEYADGSEYDWQTNASFSVADTAVPEPSTLVLLGAGLLAAGRRRLRSRGA